MTAPAMSESTDNGRYYRHPTQKSMVPSITNILHTEDKPAVNGSKVHKAVEYVVDNRERLSGLNRDEQIRLGKAQQYVPHPNSRIGDIVHAWVDQYIKTGKPPWECAPIILYAGKRNEETIDYEGAPITARRMWRQFEGFCLKHNPTFTNAEFTVWSYQYGYAGTADWSAQIGPWLVLVDTKTGTSVWPEVGKQVAALMYADVLLTVQGDETPIPKYDRGAVLHLRPTYSRFHPLDNLESCFRAFLGLKENFDHNVTYGDKVIMHAPKVEMNYQGV